MLLGLNGREHLEFFFGRDVSFPLLTVSSSTAPGPEHSILETLAAAILLLYYDFLTIFVYIVPLLLLYHVPQRCRGSG